MEKVNRNRFFKNSREKASNVLNNQDRLRNLLRSASEKLKDINLNKISNVKFLSRLKVILRMVRAYKSGQYRDVPLQSILLIVAALIYFVTPIDLIPDFIPITGFIDDFAVVVWVYSKVQEEIDKFLLWEAETDAEQQVL